MTTPIVAKQLCLYARDISPPFVVFTFINISNGNLKAWRPVFLCNIPYDFCLLYSNKQKYWESYCQLGDSKAVSIRFFVSKW